MWWRILSVVLSYCRPKWQSDRKEKKINELSPLWVATVVLCDRGRFALPESIVSRWIGDAVTSRNRSVAMACQLRPTKTKRCKWPNSPSLNNRCAGCRRHHQRARWVNGPTEEGYRGLWCSLHWTLPRHQQLQQLWQCVRIWIRPC